jgi:hypothetical protein
MSPEFSWGLVKSFKVETLFVLITTSFDHQFQDCPRPAKYTYQSCCGTILVVQGLQVEVVNADSINENHITRSAAV